MTNVMNMPKMNTTSTAQLVKQLNTLTGIGVLKCKLALEKANGDLNVALTDLKAIKFTGDSTSTCSKVFCYLHHNNRVGALIKISAKTDFALNTTEVSKLAQELAMTAATLNLTAVEELLHTSLITNPDLTVKTALENISAVLKESIVVTTVATVTA